MPSKRDSIRMSDEELRAYLAEGRTIQVASVGRDGRPHLVPMWYAVDDEGCVVFTTYGSSQKVRNLERDPRITLLVEDGAVYDELRGVMIEGEAEIVDDLDYTRDVMSLVGAKYSGERRGDAAEDRSPPDRKRAIAKRVVVRVRPQRTTSWDHCKLLNG